MTSTKTIAVRAALALILTGFALFAISFLRPQASAQKVRNAPPPYSPPAPEKARPADFLDLIPAIWSTLHGDLAALDKVAPEVLANTAPQVVMLNAFDGANRPLTAGGSAAGLVPTLRSALASMKKRSPKVPRWLRIDVVRGGTPPRDLSLDSLIDLDDLDDCLAIGDQGDVILLPDLIRGRVSADSGVVSLSTILEATNELPGLLRASPHVATKREVRIQRLSTDSYVSDGIHSYRLFHGRRLVGLPLTQDDLRTAAGQGGAYLARSTSPEGRITYVYHPEQDRAPDEENIVRHAGTLWAMLELYAVNHDEALLAAARRGLGYLAKRAVPYPKDPSLSWIIEDNHGKLGAMALAVVAFTRFQGLTKDRTHEELCKRFARYILAQQEPGGRFFPTSRLADTTPLGEESAYFPGESALACIRMHRLTGEAAWLDAARRGADWLINVRDAKVPTLKLEHDHWLLYALRELYDIRADKAYADHTFRLTESILADQIVDPKEPFRMGMYTGKERSTPTATRGEGLAQAYHVALKAAPARAPAILRALHLGAALELQTQVGPESAMFYRDPGRILGGFSATFARPEVRNDCVQHNISSLLGLASAMEEAGWKTLDATNSPAAELLAKRDRHAFRR